jgi:hypothetical protein
VVELKEQRRKDLHAVTARHEKKRKARMEKTGFEFLNTETNCVVTP